MAGVETPLKGMADAIDSSSRVPLHVQVRRLIREQTLAGALVDAEGRLMTEAELGALFGVSRITIRNALQPLVEEGLFSRTRGKGTFLRSSEIENWSGKLMGFVETVREAGLEPGSELLHQGMTNRHDAEVAAAMKERAVFELRRIRLADGTPIAIEHAYYPPDLGLELQSRDLSSAAIYRILEDELGFVIKEAMQTIEARLADAEQARHLGVEPGTPLTSVERLTIDEDGRPLELLRAAYVPERYRLSIKLTRRRADRD
ncbi:GntR family transcriptional regulator [Rhizobium azooxidifex]|uniref:GntR family transcriptional regulator n=1 Tax=Mycoplana azooxidifex TaxID=1636188 RepID=A0A7W6GJT4_9HYPH|nr:GntR family transcriptional regulator [Mycoplana azooxidifex]MBB3976234.1 GntR family transcriptional regulator [Mycoplana azooxidifex]